MKSLSHLLAASALAVGASFFAPVFSQQSGEIPTEPEAEAPSTVHSRLDPTRVYFDGEPVPMTLADVVVSALERNLDIEIGLVDVDISRERRIGEEGIYDPVLGANAGLRRVEAKSNQPSFLTSESGAGEGTTDLVHESHEMGVSLTQLVPTGARLSLGFDRTRTDFEDYRRRANPLNPEESQRAYIRVTQPLLKNFGPRATNLGIRTAKYEEEISRSLYRQEVENQIAAVMSAYWDLVFAIRNLEVQQASLEAALELERVNEARVRAGAAPRSDLFQAQAEAAQRRRNVIEAQSGILGAQDALLRLLNWAEPVNHWNRPVDPLDTPEEFDLQVEFDDQQLADEALQWRHDLEAARSVVKAAEITRDALWWQRLPELNAFAEYGVSGLSDSRTEAFDEVGSGEYEDYFVGLELRYPLFNRKGRADYRRSQRQIHRGELSLRNLELVVMTQVRAATRAIRTAQESIEASEAQVRAAQETLDSERRRLDVGASTTFNVLQFQEDLARARVNDMGAKVDYQKGLIELHRSRGLLMDAVGRQLGVDFDFDHATHQN